MKGSGSLLPIADGAGPVDDALPPDSGGHGACIMADAPNIFCRDCLSATAPPRPRCPACGSPRVIAHPERDRLSIAHVDCDAFYATIEKRDAPELRDKPVIIGGGKRGVVSTACYIARTYGVRSAMPMFKALQACPDAVVVKPDMEKYVRVGREVRRLMLEMTPLVEPLSIDEAFLDLTGTERLHKASPAVTLARFARRVEDELGITISVGLSVNKFLAKIASDLDKPRGFSIIGEADVAPFLAGKPVSIIYGIGAATQERLARAGLRTIDDVRARDAGEIVALVGKDGLRLHRLAHGIDTRKVDPVRETKSISAETTFDRDIRDVETLAPILWRLSEKLSLRLKKAGFAGRSVTLKLKTADFRTRTRSRSGIAPTQLARRLFDIAAPMLTSECDGTAFRLIGIGTTDLCDSALADVGDLADTESVRLARMEKAVDSLRERFGRTAVVRGIGFAVETGRPADKRGDSRR